MYENPFMDLHSVTMDGETTYFNQGTEKENIQATEDFLKKAKTDHPGAKIYGQLKEPGYFQFRVVY